MGRRRVSEKKLKRDKLHIHWYPGHIAKAERALKEKLSLVDVVIEVLDARLPISSGYGDIKKLLGDKPRLILLNKSDLVDTDDIKKWTAVIEARTGCPVIAIDTKTNRSFKIVEKKVLSLSEPRISALVSKGLMRRPARAVVIGLPNVGKSSIINRLTKSSKTKTGAKAGVTRQQQWVRINPDIDLLDTPGIIPMKQSNQECAQKLAFVNSVSVNTYSAETVSAKLLELINQNKKYLGKFKAYYNICDELSLENIAKSRNWITSAAEPDIARTAQYVLKDLRTGKIGRFIFDNIDDYPL